MFALSFVVLGYEVWKVLSRYQAAMDAHEASAKWSRVNRRSVAQGSGDR
jgi:hypothetical protein